MDPEDDVIYIEDDDDHDMDGYSEDDHAYDDTDGYFEDDQGDDDASYFDETPTEPKNNTYTFLMEPDIVQRVEERTATVSSVLSIPKPDASILLRHHNWNPNSVQEAWFSDETRTRKSTGLVLSEASRKRKRTVPRTLMCGICFEEIPCTSVPADAPLCGHTFCTECWTSYISTSIEGGAGCLFLRCPDLSCGAAVSPDMIKRLASIGDYMKYGNYVVNSYVECDPRTKWCPGPGCEYVVEFDCDSGGSGNYDVSCRCSHKFCWNCTEESHRPVDCVTISKWIAKNEAESENVTWILTFTKPCPKCKRPIEKSTGCNHMTCRAPCKFEFCWLCLSDYKNHVCNRYKGVDKDEVKRDMAKKSIMRYAHYFERWVTNRKSEKKALTDLREMESVKINKLSDIQFLPVTQLRFVTDAWAQIVECRRILKWTYAFGYYLCEEELAKKQFFEYLQGEAEAALERLHNCAENDLKGYIDAVGPSATFNDFQIKLTGLTAVTRNFFENLVKALENGLSDVDSSKTGKPQEMRVAEHGQVNKVVRRKRH